MSGSDSFISRRNFLKTGTTTVAGLALASSEMIEASGIDLKASKVDAIVMDELPAKQIILNNTGLVILDEEITSDSYGMIVKKGNKELLLAINKVIDRLKSEGKIDEFVLNHTEE